MRGAEPERRRAHDRALREFTATMDLAAQDRHVKSERAHFAVVGEGSRAAQEQYQRGYEQIAWRTP